jgi:hypothetical protein
VVKDAFAGKRGKCPNCLAVVDVPPPAESETGYRLAADPAEAVAPKPLKTLTEQVLKKQRPDRVRIERSRAELLRTIFESFEGEVPRARTTLGYRLGMLLVMFALLLLPAIYLLLIAGVGFGVYWHATHNFIAPVPSPYYIWMLLWGYVGPLLIGVSLLLLLIKPLFAPPPRKGADYVLEPGRETILYAFVGRIAEAVGAPEPKRIAVSCEVNASASLGRGLGGLFGHELTLTLGLPLFAGLNTRQLSGLVAHELGHFAQGAGMRASYVVRSLNAWLARLACQRDAWDERLSSSSLESAGMIPIYLAIMFCVWLTRRVLWVLMMIGHALSCLLLRQMEYDADRYMARLAGTETFEEIARRMALWEASSQAAFSLAPRWWIQDRYPDDLPSLILSTADRIPKKKHRRIQQDLNKSRTGLFDTHPCLKARLANVGREATDGVFQFDEPATVLLENYPKLSLQATLHTYRATFGPHVTRDQLIHVVDLEDSVEPLPKPSTREGM